MKADRQAGGVRQALAGQSAVSQRSSQSNKLRWQSCQGGTQDLTGTLPSIRASLTSSYAGVECCRQKASGSPSVRRKASSWPAARPQSTWKAVQQPPWEHRTTAPPPWRQRLQERATRSAGRRSSTTPSIQSGLLRVTSGIQRAQAMWMWGWEPGPPAATTLPSDSTCGQSTTGSEDGPSGWKAGGCCWGGMRRASLNQQGSGRSAAQGQPAAQQPGQQDLCGMWQAEHRTLRMPPPTTGQQQQLAASGSSPARQASQSHSPSGTLVKP